MAINMGLHPLIVNRGADKRKFRWMLDIVPYIGESVKVLPPHKSARPNLTFKEYSVEHLNETIYFPGRPDWATLDVSIYDIKCKENLIYNWLKKIYNPNPASGFYGPSLPTTENRGKGDKGYKLTATLTLYSGCGDVLETWIYMNIYPLKIDWGDLDMSSSDVTTVDLSLRYDRAYLVEATNPLTNGVIQIPSPLVQGVAGS